MLLTAAHVDQAIRMATYCHSGQLRKDGLPFIKHPLEVWTKLLEWGVTDYATWIAAILHDTIEDADTVSPEATRKLIEATFGRPVLDMVEQLTIQPGEGKDAYIRRLAQDADDAVVTIKLAERYCNVSDFARVDYEKAKRYMTYFHPFLTIVSGRRLTLASEPYQRGWIALVALSHSLRCPEFAVH